MNSDDETREPRANGAFKPSLVRQPTITTLPKLLEHLVAWICGGRDLDIVLGGNLSLVSGRV